MRSTETTAQSEKPTISWVRKVDGSVVGFDPTKLASSLLHARRHVQPKDAALVSQELAQAVQHFLQEEFGGQIPSTLEIRETVIKVLKEIGQNSTASAYREFAERRKKQRKQIRVLEPRTGPTVDTLLTSDTDSEEGWDKARLVRDLQAEAGLDWGTARELAAAVERRLLACGFTYVSTGLIRELIDCELLERGMDRVLKRRRLLGAPASLVEDQTRLQTPAGVCAWAGRELLRQYAFQQVFSPDVVGLSEEGLLRLFGAGSPMTWSVVSLGARPPAAGSIQDQLHDWSRTLDDWLPFVDGALAIDGLDATLALVSDGRCDASEHARAVAGVLEQVTRDRRPLLILNLHGAIPDRLILGASDGPLFAQQPTDEQHAYANRFALELVEKILESPTLAQRVRIDLHPPIERSEKELAEWLKPWLKWMVRPIGVGLAFDRAETPLVEGLPTSAQEVSYVCQYVGLHLPNLLARLGPGADDQTLTHRLGLLCESAVRAAVQKREYLRQRIVGPESSRQRDDANRPMVAVFVPIGLDFLVKELIGKSMAEDESALAFAQQLVAQLSQRLRREGRHYQLDCRVDGLPRAAHLAWPGLEDPRQAAGLTTGIPGPGPKQQLRAAGQLHNLFGLGTSFCRLPNDTSDPDRLLEWVLFAARQTQLCRVRFQNPTPAKQANLAEDW